MEVGMGVGVAVFWGVIGRGMMSLVAPLNGD